MVAVIIIPYRQQDGMDRAKQLDQCLDRLQEQVPDIPVIVVEQGPGAAFHRGALLNAAFKWACAHVPGLTYFFAHDCDLLPDPEMATLYRDHTAPFHCLAGRGTRYSGSATYVGGVTGFSRDAFWQMNGYPVEDAYGWGGEDDEMRRRAQTCGIPIRRNTSRGMFLDLEGTGLAAKLDWLRVHPEQKNQRKWELKAAHGSTWHTNGLRGIQPVPRVAQGHGSVGSYPRCVHLFVPIVAPEV